MSAKDDVTLIAHRATAHHAGMTIRTVEETFLGDEVLIEMATHPLAQSAHRALLEAGYRAEIRGDRTVAVTTIPTEETRMAKTPPAARPKLPPFNGEDVVRTEIKFTGVGTGFTGLDVQPIVMEFDEEAFFVVKVKAAESASHYRDNKGLLVRLQRVHAESMAPIDQETASKALQEYAQRIEDAKAALDGQGTIDGELAERERAAQEAEEHDGDGTPPDEVAAAAKRRATAASGKQDT